MKIWIVLEVWKEGVRTEEYNISRGKRYKKEYGEKYLKRERGRGGVGGGRAK